MKALILNCTLKRGPEKSNTELLAQEMIEPLQASGIECEMIRLVDHNILPGVEKNMGEGDAWPAIAEKVLASEILIIATPTWLGQASSVAQRAIERLDAFITETDDDGKPVLYDKVAGVVVTGNEDVAHHIIATTAQAMIDVGYTVPAQAWAYWNMGPGPGPNYSDTDHGHEWSKTTAQTAAQNLIVVAEALQKHPLKVPKS